MKYTPKTFKETNFFAKNKSKKPQFIQEFKLLQRKTQLLYNGILLSHKKEPIWVSYNEVNESIAYYTEWSMSERQILYINAYIWHLERRYWWTDLQGSNGDRNIEKRLWTWGGGKESMGSMGIHCMSRGAQTGVLWPPRGVGWGRKEGQEGGDICTPMADSCCYMAESNIILQINYPSIKNY